MSQFGPTPRSASTLSKCANSQIYRPWVSRVSSPAERARSGALADPHAFFTIWTRKEALLAREDSVEAVLATVDSQSRPSARWITVVRLDYGIVFFTGHDTRFHCSVSSSVESLDVIIGGCPRRVKRLTAVQFSCDRSVRNYCEADRQLLYHGSVMNGIGAIAAVAFARSWRHRPALCVGAAGDHPRTIALAGGPAGRRPRRPRDHGRLPGRDRRPGRS